ncbi:RIO1 family regulatory kinase/ATPase [Stygiolobus caldivivus]|uniref:non-specific serine/threonine protein kinase n=1 Tax=Stygiolobus caldivivus TaxID=2824673 RepID=A0A8D5U6V6_9CREN|nr:RIO1 family regulatory kinase/ATPase [Stygiolobus caldivivus]BCU70398.1 hypothetical protein KN1_16950 [Stygiolobus caldivivus]
MPSLTLAERASLVGPLDYKVLKTIYSLHRNHEWIRTSELVEETGLSLRELQPVLVKLYDLRLLSKQIVTGEHSYRITFTALDILAIKKLYVDKVLKSLGIVIGVGKESEVYMGYNFSDEPVVVKFHRVGKRSYKNIRKIRNISKNKDWSIISVENAEKEYHALSCIKKNYGYVPEPFSNAYNAVVMELVEGNELYRSELDDPRGVLDQIISTVRIAYNECKMIHGDLSEYNVLVRDNTAYVIDWPQWSSTDNEDLLVRDIDHILAYFIKRYGIEENTEKILEYIKGKT